MRRCGSSNRTFAATAKLNENEFTQRGPSCRSPFALQLPVSVSKETSLSRQTLIRIRDKPAVAAQVLERWGDVIVGVLIPIGGFLFIAQLRLRY